MLNKIMISGVLFLLALGVRADELSINPDHPEKYTVVKGDTLWDISARFLEQPWRWAEIWSVNPQINDPHLIYPGDVISLSYQDGQPMLNVQRGTGPTVASGRYVKLSPEIRRSEKTKAIPVIPIDAIQQFLIHPLVLDDNEMEQWPYVVSSYDQHLIATTGNTIYIRGLPESSNTNRYSIYRKGPAYVDPGKDKDAAEKILGYEAIYIGEATVQKNGDPAAAVITAADKEILIGDRLLPRSDEDVNTEFVPSSINFDVEGSILSVVGGVSQIGQYQIVVLNLGAEQGIEPGNILGVYQSGYVVQDRIGLNKPAKTAKEIETERAAALEKATSDIGSTATKLGHVLQDGIAWFHESFPNIVNTQDKTEDVKLPEEHVGVVMVFRIFDKVSYALVMETRGPVHVLDTVKRI